MRAFPRNENGCTAFFKKCPYYDICHTKQGNNPLKYAEEIPIGFAINIWDPRVTQDSEAQKFTLDTPSLVDSQEEVK